MLADRADENGTSYPYHPLHPPDPRLRSWVSYKCDVLTRSLPLGVLTPLFLPDEVHVRKVSSYGSDLRREAITLVRCRDGVASADRDVVE